MHLNCNRPLAILLLPAALLGLASCSSTPKIKPTTTMLYVEGVPGGTMVQTYENSATVTAINPTNRMVTIVTPDGRMDTFKAGPEVANFDQIRIGDQVKATMIQECVVKLRKPGSPVTQGEASLVGVTPPGAKPGMVVVGAREVTARVKSVNAKRHQATLIFPDGKTKTFDVREDVELARVAPNDEVSILVTESVALRVEKP